MQQEIYTHFTGNDWFRSFLAIMLDNSHWWSRLGACERVIQSLSSTQEHSPDSKERIDTEIQLAIAQKIKDQILLLHPEVNNCSFEENQKKYSLEAFQADMAGKIAVKMLAIETRIPEDVASLLFYLNNIPPEIQSVFSELTGDSSTLMSTVETIWSNSQSLAGVTLQKLFQINQEKLLHAKSSNSNSLMLNGSLY